MSDPKVPEVVSQRNHFTAASEYVEQALPHLPEQFKHEDFGYWLERYTETVIRGVSRSFAVAAERGIEQAVKLICDPTFYETRKRRRAVETKRMKDEMERQDNERVEQMHCPTAEQIEDQIGAVERSIKWHQESLVKYEANLLRLRALTPKNIRFPTRPQ